MCTILAGGERELISNIFTGLHGTQIYSISSPVTCVLSKYISSGYFLPGDRSFPKLDKNK